MTEKYTIDIRELCAKCKGKCCRSYEGYSGNTILLKREIEVIEQNTNYRDFYEEVKVNNLIMYQLKHQDNKCIFLEENGDCKIAEFKSFDCRYFPIIFRHNNNKITPVLCTRCPYGEEIDSGILKQAKREMLKELKEWSDEELTGWSNLIFDDKAKEI